MTNVEYEPTIGVECHVQLATATKLFSQSSNDARSAAPNDNTNFSDFGLPGTLPVLNKKAVELAVIAAKALNADVAHKSQFDRKHYFYPDLPKGYQTTQMYYPIILGGYVEAPLEDGGVVKVTLDHAHLEDDAGKLTHYGDYSLVDLNRAGAPLIEIVSNPDIHSPQEAKAYARELHRLMVFSGVSLGDLYHGNMRFDINVSVAPKGSSKLGVRTEIKNLNSFRSIEKAAAYEIKRQIEALKKGEALVQETRGWDEARQKTVAQRSKEDAQDYRYMPDPDSPIVVLAPDEVAAMQEGMPLLPSHYRNKWRKLNLDPSVEGALLDNHAFTVIVDTVQSSAGDKAAKRAAHWLTSGLSVVTSENDLDSGTQASLYIPTAEQLAALSAMVEAGELSSTSAKTVLNHLEDTSQNVLEVAKALAVIQVSDSSAIEEVVMTVLNSPESAQSIADIKGGKDKAIGYLVGQVMKASKGQANPGMVSKVIKEKIDEI